MHPILTRSDRMGPYLAAWVPIAAIMAVLIRLAAGSSWLEAGVLAAPLAVVDAFICLAAWYPCRATPLRRASLGQVLLTHALAGAISTVLWLFLALTWASLLESWPPFVGVSQRFPRFVVVLLVTGLLLYTLAAVLHYLVIAFEDASHAERRELELRLLAREAELKALRSQVDPHFLFNTMNSIAALVVSDPRMAREMCLTLAEFLRDSLRLGGMEAIPLAEELALADKYLAIERVRFGARLRITRETAADCAACEVPPLLLQPLVENAVSRGIATMLDGGELRITSARAGERLTIVLENPFDDAATTSPGTGLGLENVRARVAAAYDGGGRVSVERRDGRFRVELDLPARPTMSSTAAGERAEGGR
jgi:two-component system, LytTR family, sensor histidine kinase AlgZ